MGKDTTMKDGLHTYKGKRVLLLQGPVGPFFWRLSRDLAWAGAQVCKVNFNGGDCLFYPLGAIAFRGKMETWPDFLSQLIEEKRFDVVLFFGDCRPIHAAVHAIATRHDVEVGVFEEGYLRPDFITLEKGGVNGFSQLPHAPILYLNNSCQSHPEPKQVGKVFRYVAIWAMLYYFASTLFQPLFRHYRHHRPLNPLEALPWIRALWRKGSFKVKEGRIQALLQTRQSGNYFLVPLQVHSDAQVHVHSPFESVTEFIHHVMKSFAEYAPAPAVLVIKHHPLDRGYREYGRFIRNEADALGINERVMVIHDQHLPTLLEHARGVVVINSTVGLSSIHHNTPVKVCGSAIYDMQGMTFQGELDEFWEAAADEKIDRELYGRFRSYLIEKTQLNGSFYKRLDIPGSHTGLMWHAPATPTDFSMPESTELGVSTKAT